MVYKDWPSTCITHLSLSLPLLRAYLKELEDFGTVDGYG